MQIPSIFYSVFIVTIAAHAGQFPSNNKRPIAARSPEAALVAGNAKRQRQQVESADSPINGVIEVQITDSPQLSQVTPTDDSENYGSELWQAIENGDLKEVEKCIAQGINVNEQGPGGTPLLVHAATFPDQEIAVKMIESLTQAGVKSCLFSEQTVSYLLPKAAITTLLN